MVSRQWHQYPDPTEVDFLKVIRVPIVETSPHRKTIVRGDTFSYGAGVLDVVIRARRYPYLNSAGKIVGYSGEAAQRH